MGKRVGEQESEGCRMAEKMLVTQALDERDLLIKKIQNKIAKASFTDVKKRNEKKVQERRIPEDDFCQEAKSAYQQIMDLIERFQQIDAAIVASNAATIIHISFGDYTVAGLCCRVNQSACLENKNDYERTS